MNASATLTAVKSAGRGMKCANFDKRYMTTIITEQPCVITNPVMKSMAISYHILDGMRSGCNNPTGGCVLYLTYWHTTHLFTYSFVILAMCFQ